MVVNNLTSFQPALQEYKQKSGGAGFKPVAQEKVKRNETQVLRMKSNGTKQIRARNQP